MNEALFNRNATACERAKRPICRCHCGGAYHGSAHSAAWRAEPWSLIEAESRAAQPRTLELFEDQKLPA